MTDASGPHDGREPIKIMMIYEKTRGLTHPKLAQGAIAALKAINAAGGIRKRRVELIECDTLDDSKTAAEYGELAVSERVVALVGSLSVHSGDFMPTMARNKIASIGLIPATAADFTSPAAFPIVGGPAVSLAFLAGALADQGAARISLVRPDVAQTAALSVFANKGLSRFELEIANDVAVPPGTADMTSYVNAACSMDIDGLLVALAGADGVNFITAARRASPRVKIAERGADLARLVDELGEAADGILGSTYFFTLSTTNRATENFIADMEQAGFVGDDLFGRHVQDTYAAVLAFAAVAEQLPEVSAPAIFDRLPDIQGLNILGLPVQFTKGGIADLPRIFNACVLGTKLVQGRPEPLTGKFVDAFTGAECPSQ
jgi:ABC-type branched-subunit amino acid transport system substrate-binding protein